ncbi:DegT/DnrJ/EryC1/StrS family aminotransferase [Rheinheimera riviphila]|uniref:DegT/DnrJ/EryC1/StrS family aminotransferase n=1 Tax=Rheinheimera riviphila TaxID=1834037 RepID=A0A437QJ88_9GAMM|nr:DegT/DnrJ/EryC1/StrS family aminotransferase [Rheinheimera riviphila]RVU34568.1 DegT/DnrJ/EryC1/StrS family aminotransferase [Rheinheimera riviphila]
MIPYYIPTEPCFKSVCEQLAEVHKNGWYTNFGPMNNEFERCLGEYLGINYILPISSCTVGLMVASKLLNVKKIIATSFSFVATVSSMKWVGVDILFADIDVETKNICLKSVVELLESNKGCIDAIVATHVFGNPCDVEALETIGKNYGISIIYDAAHAFGVRLAEQSVLNFGDISVVSFHATKVFHSIEGGALILKNKEQYERARELINFGVNRSAVITDVGINGKMSEYHAAVGLVQLKCVDDVIAHRAKLYARYAERLCRVVNLQKWHALSSSNGAYFPIFFENMNQRDKAISHLEGKQIGYKRYFSTNLNNSMFAVDGVFASPNSEHACGTALCLPLYHRLTIEQVDIVSTTIVESFR